MQSCSEFDRETFSAKFCKTACNRVRCGQPSVFPVRVPLKCRNKSMQTNIHKQLNNNKVTKVRKKKKHTFSKHPLIVNWPWVSLLSNFEVLDQMPSSAAIGFLKIDVWHKGRLETEASSQYFYWSMCSSLLEIIDSLFVSNWPWTCCTMMGLHINNSAYVPICTCCPSLCLIAEEIIQACLSLYWNCHISQAFQNIIIMLYVAFTL